jgi:hypothetical protein
LLVSHHQSTHFLIRHHSQMSLLVGSHSRLPSTWFSSAAVTLQPQIIKYTWRQHKGQEIANWNCLKWHKQVNLCSIWTYNQGIVQKAEIHIPRTFKIGFKEVLAGLQKCVESMRK